MVLSPATPRLESAETALCLEATTTLPKGWLEDSDSLAMMFLTLIAIIALVCLAAYPPWRKK
jgi:hypothetical protein